MIKPLFGAQDDEWVVIVGRYVLNMGALEMATRLLIERIKNKDTEPRFATACPAVSDFFVRDFPVRTRKGIHGQ
jgi:hypothetical protein